jgi:hypothetical protein
MDCERVKNLYKESCKNLVKDVYKVESKEETPAIDNCLRSITLYESFCMSNNKLNKGGDAKRFEK